MLGREDNQSDFFDVYLYEAMIPKDHILVEIKEKIDFSFVEGETRDLYSPGVGRPSWPPEVLFRMLFLEYYYNLSDVEVARQSQYNLLWRYFIGLSLGDKIPDDTSLVVFRRRLGEERFERLFNRVVVQAKEKGLLRGGVKIVDATSVVADVAIPNTVNLLRQGRKVILRRISRTNPTASQELSKRYRTEVRLCTKPRSEELAEEVEISKEFVSEVRRRFGEEVDELLGWMEGLLNPEDGGAKIVSFIDTDARHGVKSPKRMFSGYKAHIAEDESEIVTSVEVLQGNRNEGHRLPEILDKEEEKEIKSEAVTADALYDSYVNRIDVHSRKMKAYIPLRRKTKSADGFRYIPEEDRLVCPQGYYSHSKNRQGTGYFYNFSPSQCQRCRLSSTCAAFKKKRRRSRIYISDDLRLALQDDDEFRREALSLRRMVERKFGEGKRWHNLGRARYRGRWRVAIQVFMTFLVMNVKRMTRMLQKRGESTTAGELAAVSS